MSSTYSPKCVVEESIKPTKPVKRKATCVNKPAKNDTKGMENELSLDTIIDKTATNHVIKDIENITDTVDIITTSIQESLLSKFSKFRKTTISKLTHITSLDTSDGNNCILVENIDKDFDLFEEMLKVIIILSENRDKQQ